MGTLIVLGIGLGHVGATEGFAASAVELTESEKSPLCCGREELWLVRVGQGLLELNQ